MNTEQRIEEAFIKCTCGLFGTRDSMEEAREYGMAILKNSTKDDREAMVHISLGVYHNSLVKAMMGIVKDVLNPTTEPVRRETLLANAHLICTQSNSRLYTKGNTYFVNKVLHGGDQLILEDNDNECRWAANSILSPSEEIKFELII